MLPGYMLRACFSRQFGMPCVCADRVPGLPLAKCHPKGQRHEEVSLESIYLLFFLPSLHPPGSLPSKAFLSSSSRTWGEVRLAPHTRDSPDPFTCPG